MTFVRLFHPRFAGLVESGAKLQTVRPSPKRMPKPGDAHEGRYGFLHAEDDDGPFDVDGVEYCGRCHVALPSPPSICEFCNNPVPKGTIYHPECRQRHEEREAR